MSSTTAAATLRQVFESEATFASTMAVALSDLLGSQEWMQWEPESVEMEIRNLTNATMPQDNLDKLMALALALTTNQFYVSLEAFISICNALAGDGASFEMFDPADVEEMCWAVTEVLLNDDEPALPLEQLFSQEIRYYIGETAKYEGFKELPPTLSFGEMEDLYGAATEAMADEAMFSAFYSTAKEEIAEVMSLTKQKRKKMMEQIAMLPLQHGDPDAWKKFSGTTLTSRRSTSSPAEAGRHRAQPLT